jgi:hypothetical protein
VVFGEDHRGLLVLGSDPVVVVVSREGTYRLAAVFR